TEANDFIRRKGTQEAQNAQEGFRSFLCILCFLCSFPLKRHGCREILFRTESRAAAGVPQLAARSPALRRNNPEHTFDSDRDTQIPHLLRNVAAAEGSAMLPSVFTERFTLIVSSGND